MPKRKYPRYVTKQEAQQIKVKRTNLDISENVTLSQLGPQPFVLILTV